MVLASDQVERLRRDLDALIAPGERVGIAVSGGPDSMALLLLAAAARPGLIHAATVDHGLRPAAADEAAFVARICGELGVEHQILNVDWPEIPATAVQERARGARYAELGEWAGSLGIGAVATGHHADDQLETLLMRLNRGAGIKGLSAMRPASTMPGSLGIRLLRPLLGWRRSDLEQICADAGVSAIEDPSNDDEQYERVRVRKSLKEADWLDPLMAARSAALIGEADAALRWAADVEWAAQVQEDAGAILYRPLNAPDEIVRRIVHRAVTRIGREGSLQLRGRELDQLMAALRSGRRATLRGVLCSGGEIWRFVAAPDRTRRERQFD